jgi:NAD-dependent deacetylase
MSSIEQVASLWKNAQCVLAFTGAGLSTGSGIPDFRGPQGVWTTRQPVYYDEFLASESKRIEHWDYKLEGYEAFLQAKPNAAHLALAELEKMGKLDTLVTQNIDGLHHRAGNSEQRTLEVHGTNRQVECQTCGQLSDPAPAFAEFRQSRRCPRCSCGGPLKTATISFGQSMPEPLMLRAFEAAERADLVISLGSTLSVEPAASVPRRAAQRGADYVIINSGETAHDRMATVRLSGDLCELLPNIVSLLRAL